MTLKTSSPSRPISEERSNGSKGKEAGLKNEYLVCYSALRKGMRRKKVVMGDDDVRCAMKKKKR